MKKNRKECKKVNCPRKGFYTETSETGEKLLCIPARHDGDDHVQKFTLADLNQLLKD